MKRMARILSLLLVVFLLTGCSLPGSGDKEKVFTKAGVSMTLNNSFLDYTNTKQNEEQYPFFYVSAEIGLMGVEETKAELAENFGEHTVDSYAELIIDLYQLNATVQHKDGFTYFTYETEAEGTMYTFTSVIVDAGDAFWNLQGYCATSVYSKNQETIWKFLTTAKIS